MVKYIVRISDIYIFCNLLEVLNECATVHLFGAYYKVLYIVLYTSFLDFFGIVRLMEVSKRRRRRFDRIPFRPVNPSSLALHRGFEMDPPHHRSHL